MNNDINILFIDDSQIIRNLIGKYLKSMNYNVVTAEDGRKGIEFFNEKTFDLVLTDLKMPHMNGFEVLSHIKSIDSDIPVIIISGEGEIRDVIEALHLGAWDYITKPVEDLKIIDYAIKQCLEKSDLIKKNRIYEKDLEELVKKRTEEIEFVNKQLEDTITAIVNSLATITEKKDKYTAGHQERVSKLAVQIAKEMKMSDKIISGIKIAGLLHDIGKIYVPAEILTKPSILDKYESEIIKEHCKIGYDILKEIPFPWPIADIVYQHHERLNGSGYPLGIKDNDILIESKIIAVADVVEAMSYHRPYRPALGMKKAIKEIKDNRGTLFCTVCVDACLKIYKNDNNIFAELFN